LWNPKIEHNVHKGILLPIPRASLIHTAASHPIYLKIKFNVLVSNPRSPKWFLDGDEWIWNSGGIILGRNPTELLRKDLTQCYFPHWKFHFNCPRIYPGFMQ
jgi:hypothetical protein